MADDKSWTAPGLTPSERAISVDNACGFVRSVNRRIIAEAIEAAIADFHQWHPIDTVPKDGTEVSA